MPPAEIILWARLKSKQLNRLKFRRQHSVGAYIIDFYCPEHKLAIEVDGSTHLGSDTIGYDQERQREIENLGIRFLRFTNTNIYSNIEGVLNRILIEVMSRPVKKEKQKENSPPAKGESLSAAPQCGAEPRGRRSFTG